MVFWRAFYVDDDSATWARDSVGWGCISFVFVGYSPLTFILFASHKSPIQRCAHSGLSRKFPNSRTHSPVMIAGGNGVVNYDLKKRPEGHIHYDLGKSGGGG